MKLIHKEEKGNYLLKIFELKTCLKGVLLDLKDNCKTISSAKFYFKDNEGTIFRVKEYYNF